MPRFFRIVPSPLQGTSHKILSNSRLEILVPFDVSVVTRRLGKIDASRLVTMRDGDDNRADLCSIRKTAP